jgi:uncharacterized protein (TIGR00645 family)
VPDTPETADAPSTKPRSRAASTAEHAVEAVLFGSRWLLAPLYLGMVVALVVILVKFFQELVKLIAGTLNQEIYDVMLGVLSLLDLALLANLVLIVILAGYENFVSKIVAARTSEDRPHWMGHVDFSGLKMKLIGSIVAISAIGLLQDFFNADKLSGEQLMWRVLLHLAFVLSGVLFAVMDWLGEKRLQITKQTHGHADAEDF